MFKLCKYCEIKNECQKVCDDAIKQENIDSSHHREKPNAIKEKGYTPVRQTGGINLF